MQYIKPEISTLCIGQAASIGSFLLAAGTKGKDFHYLIQEYSPAISWFSRSATDIEIHANEVLSLKKRLMKFIQSIQVKVWMKSSALERDNFMTADVAKSFGLIDEVVEKRT